MVAEQEGTTDMVSDKRRCGRLLQEPHDGLLACKGQLGGSNFPKAIWIAPYWAVMAGKQVAADAEMSAERRAEYTKGKMANGWISVDHFGGDFACGPMGQPGTDGKTAKGQREYHAPAQERACVVCAGMANLQ